MLLRLRHAIALTGLSATIATTGLVTTAHADPLASAKANAAALAKTVHELQTKAEVATERYDKAESQLALAVSQRTTADQALNAIQAEAAQAQQQVVDRARALYETGGDPAVLASMLAGTDPMNALDRYHLASAVIAYESNSAQQAARTVRKAAALDARDARISRQVTKLQVAAAAEASHVRNLLASQRKALSAANATVRRIVRADQAAAAAAGAQDFVSAVQAAGGTVNLGGTTQPPNAVVAAAIAAARSRLGSPYVWGGSGPNVFDCSGLTQWSYAHAGIQLPRVAADQYNAGPHPSLAALEPGDLLFWATDVTNPATIHHVTMYLGNGMMIAAPHTGTVVQIQPVYMPGFIGATRPWA
jgi:cell wall-associated NlpC family hydrolase